MSSVTGSITAQNTGTDWIKVVAGLEWVLSVGTTGAATITLLRRLPNTSTIYDIKTYAVSDGPEIGHAANAERVGDETEAGVLYRVGLKAGEYTSGTANVRISK